MTTPPYRAALYLRLSKDDEGAGESSSITNQRSLLTAYAKEHGYPICREYVDDGWSGTTFDRPAFQQMLRDIEGGRLNLVLTKDLSRLGRDYIQTGRYTEVYFPEQQVRCIAVNDGFDSESPYTDLAPFQHVVNEMYARDASKKIRSAFSAKMHRGSYIGSFAPYGYRKDPADKNHLLPDEGAAAVVRELFALAADGTTPAHIAQTLNARQVLTPALYRCALHPQLNPDDYTRRRAWTAATVAKLLRNVVYLGHMAQGKTTKVSFKSQKTLRNPPRDWVVVENTHLPLVDQEVFDRVQRRLEGRTCAKKGQFSNLFSGLAKCAQCGRNLSAVGTRRKGSPATLACGGYKLYGSGACSNHFIDYDALYRLVLEAVREQLHLTDQAREQLLDTLCAQLAAEEAPREEAAARHRAETEKLERIIEQLYDDRANGLIAQARFYRLLQKYQAQSAALERTAPPPAQPPTHQAQTRAELRRRLALLLEDWETLPALDADLLFALLDRIEVDQGRYLREEGRRVKHQEVTLYFRFQTQAQARVLAR